MEFYNSKDVTTRKDHKCHLCGLRIIRGTKALYESGKYDGEMFSRHSHSECSSEWVRQNKEYDHGDHWGWFENEEDGCHEEWRKKIRKLYDYSVDNEGCLIIPEGQLA